MKNFKVNPIGLKGKELHERQLQLMGMAPINENTNKSVVELTKIGPDGKIYGIVRENHEYYIKTSDKSSELVVEDFKYIGGLQNKKKEAYPSYAKAIKQLNFKFKSLSEAYGKGGDINVFVDDNLLAEHHPYSADKALSATKGMGDGQEYIVDKSGTPLSNKAKEGKEADGFGDNVADKDVDDEFEKVNIKESGFAGFSSGMGNGFSGAGNLEGNSDLYGDDIEMTEYEMAIDSMREQPIESGFDSSMLEDVYETDEMYDEDKAFAALAEPRDKITFADKIAGATSVEEDDDVFFESILKKTMTTLFEGEDTENEKNKEDFKLSIGKRSDDKFYWTVTKTSGKITKSKNGFNTKEEAKSNFYNSNTYDALKKKV